MTNITGMKPVQGELIDAVILNDTKAVAELLQRGAKVDEENETGRCALELASIYGYMQLAQLLIDCGADVNKKDAYDNTPLIRSVWGDKAEMARLLLKNGADINAANTGRWTAIMFAASRKEMAVVRVLLDKGADFSGRNIEGKTALDLAEEEGYGEIAQMLKEAAAGQANHSLAVERQKVLKARAPKVVIRGLRP
jgi:ankyrin repeat protein